MFSHLKSLIEEIYDWMHMLKIRLVIGNAIKYQMVLKDP